MRTPAALSRYETSGKKAAGSLIRKRLSHNLDIYFVRADEYFDRDCFYGDSAGDFPDNTERFAFFSRADSRGHQVNQSQIIHLHDWQAAPVAAFLRLQPERYLDLDNTKTLITIHNLAYQGLFNRDHWLALDLDPCHFNPCQFEFWGQINFLKSGLVNSDRLNTVSPTYACEIQLDGCGFGLEGVLQERAGALSGILNGVDYTVWNPETDIHISRRYSGA